jgi:hypothetical protein
MSRSHHLAMETDPLSETLCFLVTYRRIIVLLHYIMNKVHKPINCNKLSFFKIWSFCSDKNEQQQTCSIIRVKYFFLSKINSSERIKGRNFPHSTCNECSKIIHEYNAYAIHIAL